MINIFYHPSYFKTKKVFLTKQFKYSIFNNLLIDLCYFFNFSIAENLITAGPQKRINHLIKSTKNNEIFSIKKDKFPNSYIVQFDRYGEEILNKLLTTNKSNKKILIGPLYSVEYLKKLSEIVNSNKGIKILTASQSSYNNLIYEMNLNINPEKVAMFPSGIIEKSVLLKNNNKNIKKEKQCLIYYKKRREEELNELIGYLNSRNINFKLFEYGTYKNKELIKEAKLSQYGIILGSTESQGFAIQELLASNLPLVVIDKKTNKYSGYELSGTTVPFWNEKCGIKVDDIGDFKNKFNNFLSRNKEFSPSKLVLSDLTYEVFVNNLINEFKKDF